MITGIAPNKQRQLLSIGRRWTKWATTPSLDTAMGGIRLLLLSHAMQPLNPSPPPSALPPSPLIIMNQRPPPKPFPRSPTASAFSAPPIPNHRRHPLSTAVSGKFGSPTPHPQSHTSPPPPVRHSLSTRVSSHSGPLIVNDHACYFIAWWQKFDDGAAEYQAVVGESERGACAVA